MGSLVCLLAYFLNNSKDFDRMRVLNTMECACFAYCLGNLSCNISDPLSLYLDERAEIDDKFLKSRAVLSPHKDGTLLGSQVGQESMESFCSCCMKNCINVPAYKENLP